MVQKKIKKDGRKQIYLNYRHPIKGKFQNKKQFADTQTLAEQGGGPIQPMSEHPRTFLFWNPPYRVVFSSILQEVCMVHCALQYLFIIFTFRQSFRHQVICHSLLGTWVTDRLKEGVGAQVLSCIANEKLGLANCSLSVCWRSDLCPSTSYWE